MRPEVVDLCIRHPVYHQQPLYCFAGSKRQFTKTCFFIVLSLLYEPRYLIEMIATAFVLIW